MGSGRGGKRDGEYLSMAPKPPPTSKATQHSKKRKEPPTSSNSNPNKKARPNGPSNQTSKIRDARTLAAQTTSKAFKHGELDVDKFVKSREYEFRALEQGLVRSKKALTKRAFQQVPKELRRRTASHNVKKVPKRLQERAKREMKDDNTPTGAARRKKPTRHMRLRLETAKKLRAIGAKRKAAAEMAQDETVTVKSVVDAAQAPAAPAPVAKPGSLKTRKPKPKKAALADPPVPKVKFRKRQKDKSWLPTHLFHAKRARMTPPKEPLWRFALPLTPTVKSYRPTHRAASERGAVCWDVSYTSTIALHGREASIASVLKALGVDGTAWGTKGGRWREGKRAMEFLLHEREAPHAPIAPVTVLWCPADWPVADGGKKRQVFVRVHPSAFFQLWEEVVRLAKVAKPAVMVEDLRYELGGIDIVGPASTEALLSALWPSPDADDSDAVNRGAANRTFTGLAGLSNPAILPSGALLSLTIQDPRLHHPPRPVKMPKTHDCQQKLLELIASWPPESHTSVSGIFDRKARISASSSLPSQKAINRRKALAPPGQYPDPVPKDPRIPVLLYTSPDKTPNKSQQATWHLILPWKCVQPVWYSLMYTPLSTGQQPRFGGQDEQRQLALEGGQAWFPGDFPGTKAGWEWEVKEAGTRYEDWKKRPKSKRTSWEAVDLGDGKKGEVGLGWACDWTRLVEGSKMPNADISPDAMDVDPPAAPESDTTAKKGITETNGNKSAQDTAPPATTTAPRKIPELPTTPEFPSEPPPHLQHISSARIPTLLANPSLSPNIPTNALITVRISLLTRGLPTPCARIYHLPSSPTHRAAWLALHPRHKPPKSAIRAMPDKASLAALPNHEQRRILAASLLEPPRAGEDKYPACPGEEDLMGFVTSGNYDLGGGRGMGVGSLLLRKVVERGEVMREGGEGRYCVVRNSGESVGRLAMWEVI